MGTCVVFTEEAAQAGPQEAAPGAAGGAAGTGAAAGTQQRRVRHAGHSETRLVMRRVPPQPDAQPVAALPPPQAQAAAG